MSGAKQLPNLDKILNIEDMDFSASQSVGSNLAAIFGTAPKGPEVDSSLRYASVKQPVVPRNPPQIVTSSKSELILAKVVHAFKLQNGQYVSMGKLGIALTGYISTKTYQLILYRSKQEYFSIATVTLSFLYTVQANNYSSYYDDNKENWSILFENEEACIELAREIGLSRYFSKQGKAEQPMIYQDLVAGSKDVVAKEGDKILIKCNIATQIVQPLKIDSTEMETTVQISTDLNWERLLLGVCKGTKRLMIIPPARQISLGPGFPKYNDIALEVEIIDITSAVKDDSAQPKSTPVTGKASILSRMAKMGQSILPKTPIPTTTDSEDTEEELPQKATRHKRAEALGSSVQRKQSNSVQQSLGTHITDQKNIAPTTIPVPPRSLVPATTLVSPWVQNQIQPQYVTANGQLYPMVQPIPTAIDPNLNVFLSETRTQNTEIRMGMAKIADNVQKLLDKFHVIEVQNASTPATDKSMETTLKMLIGMNLSEPKRLELQNQKTIKDEPSDKSLMTMNEELTEKITALEGELKQAKETLIDEMECINKCEEEKRHLESANSLLNSRVELLEGSLAELRETSKKTLADFEQATESANEYKEKNLALENKIAELTVKCSALEDVASTPKEKYRNAEKTREIKRIMNETFQALQTQFTEESYPTNFIKATLASTLRDVTLKVLKESKRDVAVSESDISKRGSESRGKSPTDSSIKDEKKGSMDPPKLPESAFRDEPPPIPPVDLEVDGDWLL